MCFECIYASLFVCVTKELVPDRLVRLCNASRRQIRLFLKCSGDISFMFMLKDFL